jgi:hypothetical protein
VSAGAAIAVLAFAAPGAASAAPGSRSGAGAGHARPARPAAAHLAAGQVTCPHLKFFGVRGSGETKKDSAGYGKTVWDVRKTVLRAVPGAAAMAVNYPAIPVVLPTSRKKIIPFLEYIATRYHKSETTGIKNLTRGVGRFVAHCPGSHIVLAGYSQGAQVVGDTFLGHLTAAQRARVAGIAMLGDPDFNRDSGVDRGSYNGKLNGIWASLPFRSPRHVAGRLHSRVASYCLHDDPVCNFDIANLIRCGTKTKTCPHVHYINRKWRHATYVTDAGRFLVSRYHR